MIVFALLFFTAAPDVQPIELTEKHGILQIYTAAWGNETLCLLDEADHRLYFFRRRRPPTKYRGGKGKGPGELEQVFGLFWSKGHRAFVAWDRGQNKLHLWSREGLFQRSVRLPLFEGSPLAYKGKIMFGIDAPYHRNRPTRFTGIDLTNGKQTIGGILPSPEEEPGMPLPSGRRYFTWDHMPRMAGCGRILAFNQPGNRNLVLVNLFDGTQQSYQVDLPIVVIDGEALSLSKDPKNTPIRQHDNGKPYPIVHSMAFDGADRLWLLGHPTQNRYPYSVLDRHGKSLFAGFMAGMPRAIGRDHLYFLDVDDQDHVWLTRRAIDAVRAGSAGP